MTFSAQHLLGIEHLSRDDIVSILDLAEQYVALNRPWKEKSHDQNSIVCTRHQPT